MSKITLNLPLKLYTLMSKNGKFLTKKPIREYEKAWEDNINDARFWTTMGPARAQLTWWAKRHSDKGIPSILEVSTGEVTVIDETEEVKRKLLKKLVKDKTKRITHYTHQLKYTQPNDKREIDRLEGLISGLRREIDALK